jgi:hypothetical protein
MIRWSISSILFLLFVWLAFLNATVFWQRHIQKRKAPSWIPLLGGLFGVAALLALPMPIANQFWWIPLLLDWGSLPGLLYTVFYHLLLHKKVSALAKKGD